MALLARTELRPLTLLGALMIGACSSDSAVAAPAVNQDPAAAQIETSDLTHFWAAYDAGGKDGAATAFQALYLDAASEGLRDFIRARSVTASSLVAMVGLYPKYFAAIHTSDLSLTSGATAVRIRANYATIKSLYPASVFPPVTLVIGRSNTTT